MQCLRKPKRSKINNRDSVALAVRDVGKFLISGIEADEIPLMEVPPAQSCQDRQGYHNEKNFLQFERNEEQERVPELPVATAVLPLPAPAFPVQDGPQKKAGSQVAAR